MVEYRVLQQKLLDRHLHDFQDFILSYFSRMKVHEEMLSLLLILSHTVYRDLFFFSDYALCL